MSNLLVIGMFGFLVTFLSIAYASLRLGRQLICFVERLICFKLLNVDITFFTILMNLV
jgi:hypothetical protein